MVGRTTVGRTTALVFYLSFETMSRKIFIIVNNDSNHFNSSKLVNQIKKKLY